MAAAYREPDFTRDLFSGDLVTDASLVTSLRPLANWPAPLLVYPDGRKRTPAIILHMPDPMLPPDSNPVRCVALAGPEDEPDTLKGAVRICRHMQETLLASVHARSIGAMGHWATLVSASPWRDAVDPSLVPEVDQALAANPDLTPVLVLLVDTGMLPMTPMANAEIRRLKRLHPGASLHMTSLRARPGE